MSYNHGDFVILIRVTQIYPHGDHGEDVTAIFGDDVIFTHGDDVTDTHGDNIIASHGNDVIATHCDDITAVLCDYVISTHGDDVTAVLGHFFMAFHIIVIYKGVGVFHILGVGGWWGCFTRTNDIQQKMDSDSRQCPFKYCRASCLYAFE